MKHNYCVIHITILLTHVSDFEGGLNYFDHGLIMKVQKENDIYLLLDFST
jgi:hypothetical protein